MPHKQPQPCETGCCPPIVVDPCTCLDSKNSFNGTFANLSFSGGPAASGPYQTLAKTGVDCFGTDWQTGPLQPEQLVEYSFPGVSSVSNAIDYTNNFCTHDLSAKVCAPYSPLGLADDNSKFVVCFNCESGPLLNPLLYTGYARFIPSKNEICEENEYYLLNRPTYYTIVAGCEWYCRPELGIYQYRIWYRVTYSINVYYPAGIFGSTGRCENYDPIVAMIANQDGSYGLQISGGGTTSSDTTILATRNDNKAFIQAKGYDSGVAFPAQFSSYDITAWGLEDDITSLSIWNTPYNPLGWLVGTISLS